MHLIRAATVMSAFLAAIAAVPAFAQTPTVPPASKTASRPTAEQADIARKWIATPAVEQQIDAYRPAADIRYRSYAEPKAQRLWVAKIDLTAPGVRFAVTEPAQFDGADAKFETRSATTPEFAEQRGVQLAFNTSAFSPFRARMGEPMGIVGLAANDGKLYSEAEKDFGALYIARDGRVSLKGPPLSREQLWDVVPGFRMLLDDGKVIVSDQEANTDFGGVNPRTAVGVDREGKTLWIVVADGRQKNVSVGLTLVELACLFESLGCWDALNLDGGGSSTLVLEDADGLHRVINTTVGNRIPGSLREVAHNVGLYLPGAPLAPEPNEYGDELRESLIRTCATTPRGGRYSETEAGIPHDIVYGGQPVLTLPPAKRGADGGARQAAEPPATNDCGATLTAFLDAFRHWKTVRSRDGRSPRDDERWLNDIPLLDFRALVDIWYGKQPGGRLADSPPLPPGIEERRAAAAMTWLNLATPLPDWRLMRRGDIVQFWRKDGTTQTAIFWMHDRDADGRVRLWYWSANPKPRYAYSSSGNAAESRGAASGAPAIVPGIGINWEYIGDDIEPARIYGAALKSAREDLMATSLPSLPGSSDAQSKPTTQAARKPASQPTTKASTKPAAKATSKSGK